MQNHVWATKFIVPHYVSSYKIIIIYVATTDNIIIIIIKLSEERNCGLPFMFILWPLNTNKN